LIEQLLGNPYRVDRGRSIRIRFQIFLNALEDSKMKAFLLKLFFVHSLSRPCLVPWIIIAALRLSQPFDHPVFILPVRCTWQDWAERASKKPDWKRGISTGFYFFTKGFF
jgi:hypothetical protein